MNCRPLGNTGIDVSVIAFGAGPVPALLTEEVPELNRQNIIRHAIDRGINWFDTAATYGAGASESNLGACLAALGATRSVHLATKVRLMPDHLSDITGNLQASFTASLRRLRTERVTLLQLHNSVTRRRGELETSLTAEDVLAPGGVLETMRRLQDAGLVEHLGLTGLGTPDVLRQLISTGAFATIQIPFNVLNPTAGYTCPPEFSEADYGNVLADCLKQGMGAFAIRVYAGGALVGQAPSAHTQTTKFFPLDLYQRDQQRASHLREQLPPRLPLPAAGIRFVLGHPAISSAIIGFSEAAQIDAAVTYADAGPLSPDLTELVLREMKHS